MMCTWGSNLSTPLIMLSNKNQTSYYQMLERLEVTVGVP